ESQRAPLRAFCDTIVPSVEHEPDPGGLWRTSATDLGVEAGVEELIAGIPDEVIRGGLVELLDVIADQGLDKAPSQLSREQIVRTLAQGGAKVIVLEAAGYYNESDFSQLELKAYQEMYWRGGPTPTADGNITLQAGTALGGGTVINWTNCLRTRDWVREQWATEFGLEGVDGPDYDRHLDAVLERIGATDQASDLNAPQQRLREGCEALGWHFGTIVRNADLSKYAPETAGYIGFGDQSGSKQSADKTWLLDAYENDAELLIHTRAQRILVEGGRAAGVEAVYLGPDGTDQRAVTVRAPHVVVACGALESPALLLRSGI